MSGSDIASGSFGYSFNFIKNEFRNAALRYNVNAFLVSDPDTPMVRNVSEEEAKLALSAALMAGRIFILGDDLAGLDAERRGWLQAVGNLPLLDTLRQTPGHGATPVDLYGPPIDGGPTYLELIINADYHVPGVWTLPLADGRELVGFFNWGDSAADMTYRFPGAQPQSAVELWSAQSVALSSGHVTVSVPAHGARLVALQP